MRKRKTSIQQIILGLSFLSIVAIILYFWPIGRPLTAYALKARSQKLLAYLLVAIGTSLSSISFQTLSGSRFLTPNILGLENLYVLIQTIFYWFSWKLVGDLALDPIIECLLLMGIQALFFMVLQPMIQTLLKQGLMLILLICMALGTLFRSLSIFIQVSMDPNEYDQLQAKLFPSFQRMNLEILGLLLMFSVGLVIFYWRKTAILDVLHLGRDTATVLGVQVEREKRRILWLIVLTVSAITALVGPLAYLGFLVSNLTYELTKTYRHRELFTVGSLMGLLILVSGQFIIERLLGYNLNTSMIIELIGGSLFFYLIYRERKKA
ncbi:iron chelate uptake ABC transporter family permease subunit [Streptococcus merionis]|uniref:iron chelate uptake ABC transporter family permease subunit n=1 Tax=Streptococcus merionis TaxID=400065 RepID=UPI0026F13364|nr:iron chelate uptake ABC transporter family permease subunit [Streptococcus merionis]